MSNNFASIKTNRLLLREIQDSDIEYIYRGLSDPNVIKYYGVSYNSLKETKEQMEWFKEPKQLWWAICDIDNQIFYGAGGLNDINLKEKKAEIGLWLLPDFWGQGIMKEVLPLVCDYGFNQLNLKRIEGFVDSNNTNCKNAMNKLDFQLEKKLKDCESKDGKPISVDVYVKNNP